MNPSSDLRKRLEAIGTVYARSLELLKPLWNGDPTVPRYVAKRVAVRLLELAPEHGDALLGLALYRANRISIAEHSLKTGIVLANLVSFLEFPRPLALDAVTAGLLHHVGGDTHGPYAHNPGARSQRSLLAYLLNNNSTASHYRQLLAAAQHELGFDGTGVPRLDFPIRQHFMSHLLTVANDFTEFTSGRSADPGSREAIPAVRALHLMTKAPGKRYHPAIIRALARVVGPAPVGSIVVLEDKREGEVLSYAPAVDGWRGTIAIVGASELLVPIGKDLGPTIKAVRNLVPHLPKVAA